MINVNDSHFKATLKDTSKDDSDKTNIEYMTQSNLETINFDLIKRVYANSLGLSEEVAYSVDALFKDIFFIEFKNGKIDKATKRNIGNKIRDSLLLYNDIYNVSVSDIRDKAVFILVYNEQKNQQGHYKNFITDSVMKLAKEKKISFGLERFQHLYFKKVCTYNQEEFDEFLKSHA